MVLELCLPFMFVWTCTARSASARYALGCATLAAACALFLTFSRAGLVAGLAAAAVLVLGLSDGGRAWTRRLGILGLSGAGVSLLIIPAAVNAQLLDRFASELLLVTYHATYDVPPTLTARPAALELVPIRVSNLGPTVWSATGPRRFGLGYHIWSADGLPITYDGEAAPLPADVPPGGTIEVAGRLRVPGPGTYRIQWDALQEGVGWFSWAENQSAWTTVTVDGNAGADGSPRRAPGGAAVLPPTFNRIFAWMTAWRMVLDRPVLGVGPDNYRWRFGDYSGLTLSHIGVHAHNIYLEWLADGGIIGLLASAWFSLELFRASLRGVTDARSGSSDRLWRLAIVAALTAWFTHGLLDDFFRYTPTLVAFCMIAGLAASTAAGRTSASSTSKGQA
jgi:hypothetical protein